MSSIFSGGLGPPGLDKAIGALGTAASLVPFVFDLAGDPLGLGLADRIPFGPDARGWMIGAPELGTAIFCPHEIREQTIDRNPNVRSSGGFSDGRPTLGPSTSGPKSMPLTGEFVARYASEDLRQVRTLLEKMDTVIPTLRRKPIVVGVWLDMQVRGFFSRLTLKFADGVWKSTNNPRKLIIQVEIQEARLARFSDVALEARPQETRYYDLMHGQTFESIALDLYGDPLKGDLIRRINHQIPLTGEVAGDRIRVFEPDHPSVELDVTPVGPPFTGAAYSEQIQELAVGLEDRTGLEADELRAELGIE